MEPKRKQQLYAVGGFILVLLGVVLFITGKDAFALVSAGVLTVLGVVALWLLRKQLKAAGKEEECHGHLPRVRRVPG